jgi:hypothetical protein
MSPNKLLARHELPNGLILEVWDRSHPVAADRHRVVLEARIAIPVNGSALPPELASQAETVTAALGPELIFTRREERNFIPEAEVAVILDDMKTRLLTLAPAYLGHPEFAPRFIRQKYQEYLKGSAS